MTEPAFREIQLTKKQLVFLFMASVVLAAVVFLLGVSLGRRLPDGTQSAGPLTPAADETAPTEMPAPTVLTADDQKYATELQGSGVVPPAVPVPPPAPPAAPATPAEIKPSPSATPAPSVAKPAEAPAARGAATPPIVAGQPESQAAAATKPQNPSAPAGTWFLQVNAFRSRENAEAEVRQLKARGHAAFVAPGGTLFRVRVGPFRDRSEADAASAKLRQDGFKPSITR